MSADVCVCICDEGPRMDTEILVTQQCIGWVRFSIVARVIYVVKAIANELFFYMYIQPDGFGALHGDFCGGR